MAILIGCFTTDHLPGLVPHQGWRCDVMGGGDAFYRRSLPRASTHPVSDVLWCHGLIERPREDQQCSSSISQRKYPKAAMPDLSTSELVVRRHRVPINIVLFLPEWATIPCSDIPSSWSGSDDRPRLHLVSSRPVSRHAAESTCAREVSNSSRTMEHIAFRSRNTP